MDNCYLCGEFFNGLDVVKHDEHIIQQAIGGTLTANDILCKKCGGDLGKSVDAPFNRIFDSICTRLDIRKHRDNNRTKTAKGFISSNKDGYGNDLMGVEVFWKKGKVTPVIPIHRYTADKSKVIVYAENKQLENYLKKVKKEINDNFDTASNPEVIICDDITGFVTYPLEFDNKSFKKGLAKIAIGFASMSGIDRDCLDLVLDSELGKIKEEALLLQFYPLSFFDGIIEREKIEIGYYPAHTLIVFTAASNNNILACYIELFSTFQWYVILSENYHGDPVYEGYCQRVDKVEDYKFEPGRRHHKERGTILSSLGIDQERISSVYEKQKCLPAERSIEDIEYEIIQKEYIKQKHQVFFNNEVEASIRYVLDKSIGMMGSKSLPLAAAIDIKNNNDLFFEIDDDEEEIFSSSSYRRYYAYESHYRDYIISLLEFYKDEESRENMRKYGHEKVHMLSAYIQKKNIMEKIEP